MSYAKLGFLEVVGEVESVDPVFYVKKDGSEIAAIRLKDAKYPFVDWNHKITELPEVGTQVRIIYRNWTPRGLKGIAYHHVIEVLQIVPRTELEDSESKPTENTKIMEGRKDESVN